LERKDKFGKVLNQIEFKAENLLVSPIFSLDRLLCHSLLRSELYRAKNKAYKSATQVKPNRFAKAGLQKILNASEY